jgi:hypothetical protein
MRLQIAEPSIPFAPVRPLLSRFVHPGCTTRLLRFYVRFLFAKHIKTPTRVKKSPGLSPADPARNPASPQVWLLLSVLIFRS